MRDSKKMYVVILLISTLLGAFGQVLFKEGVVSGFEMLALYLFLGLVSYGISTILYFYVISRTHLSWAYGFVGLSYIFASAIAFVFLSEQVPVLRWVGILVIAVGTVLVGAS
jgi:uncharacterized membrane protein